MRGIHSKNRGVSSVISAIAIVLILMIVSESVALVSMGNLNVTQSNMKAQTIEAKKAGENVVLDINPWLKEVEAAGSSTGWVSKIMIVHDSKVRVVDADFVDGKMTLKNVKDGDRIGIVTSLGNVYWVKQPYKGELTVKVENLPSGYSFNTYIGSSEWSGSGRIGGKRSYSVEVYPGQYNVKISGGLGSEEKSAYVQEKGKTTITFTVKATPYTKYVKKTVTYRALETVPVKKVGYVTWTKTFNKVSFFVSKEGDVRKYVKFARPVETGKNVPVKDWMTRNLGVPRNARCTLIQTGYWQITHKYIDHYVRMTGVFEAPQPGKNCMKFKAGEKTISKYVEKKFGGYISEVVNSPRSFPSSFAYMELNKKAKNAFTTAVYMTQVTATGGCTRFKSGFHWVTGTVKVPNPEYSGKSPVYECRKIILGYHSKAVYKSGVYSTPQAGKSCSRFIDHYTGKTAVYSYPPPGKPCARYTVGYINKVRYRWVRTPYTVYRWVIKPKLTRVPYTAYEYVLRRKLVRTPYTAYRYSWRYRWVKTPYTVYRWVRHVSYRWTLVKHTGYHYSRSCHREYTPIRHYYTVRVCGWHSTPKMVHVSIVGLGSYWFPKFYYCENVQKSYLTWGWRTRCSYGWKPYTYYTWKLMPHYSYVKVSYTANRWTLRHELVKSPYTAYRYSWRYSWVLQPYTAYRYKLVYRRVRVPYTIYRWTLKRELVRTPVYRYRCTWNIPVYKWRCTWNTVVKTPVYGWKCKVSDYKYSCSWRWYAYVKGYISEKVPTYKYKCTWNKPVYSYIANKYPTYNYKCVWRTAVSYTVYVQQWVTRTKTETVPVTKYKYSLSS